MRYHGILALSFGIFVLAHPSSAQAVWQIAYPPQSPAGNRDRAAPYSLAWVGDTVRTVVGPLAPASPGAVLVTSLSQSFLPMSLAPLGAPGFDLLLPPDVLEFEAASGESRADWALAIPATVTFAGVNFYQEAFPFEFGVNPLNVTASNGLTLTIGLR